MNNQNKYSQIKLHQAMLRTFAICMFLIVTWSFIPFELKAEASSGETVVLDTGSGKLEGTLLIPKTNEQIPVVLIIAGSGPTDRDGNQPMMINNSLKFLAEGLYKHGIASIRFDKRGIGKSSGAMISESELRFEHYVDDAAGWITLLKEDSRFSGVVVAGHSEGSLIGMLAARKAGAAGFISLAGSGRPLDEVIRIQLKNQPAFILDEALPILDQLSNGAMVDEVSPMLQPLFRKSVQPYLISQFRYNPAVEIANLEIPVMIIQGTTDIQIGVEDAEILYKAIPSATLKIVEGMNHILKESNKDMQQNLATYSNPNLPIFEGLNNAIARFVAELEM